MRPEAGAFFRAALVGLDHAEEHLDGRTPLDVSQILLSLDYMAEMLLKAALLERGESIMERPQRSIGLQAALKRFGTNPYASLIEVLRERRDTLQHFALYSDRETVLELADGARRFATELVRSEFGLDLDETRGKHGPPSAPEPTRGEALEAVTDIQRDASFGGGILAWAQGRPGSSRLGVRIRETNGKSKWLTPDEDFEYMPHTDGKHVVAYRQSGGIVRYDLGSGERAVLSETGGPGAVAGGLVAAQGIGIAGGLAGGVWLIPLTGGEPQQVARPGDSPRLSGQHVVWQELDEGALKVRIRQVSRRR